MSPGQDEQYRCSAIAEFEVLAVLWPPLDQPPAPPLDAVTAAPAAAPRRSPAGRARRRRHRLIADAAAAELDQVGGPAIAVSDTAVAAELAHELPELVVLD